MRNSWSAVSCGAALGIHISTRKARQHYGVPCRTSFVYGLHPLKNLVYDSYSGMAFCDNWIRWYIKKVGLVLHIHSSEEGLFLTLYLG